MSIFLRLDPSSPPSQRLIIILSRDIIIGVYVIIFGLGRVFQELGMSRFNKYTAIAGLELLPQVPPYVPKYASFLFSFLGRGVCECSIHGTRCQESQIRVGFS